MDNPVLLILRAGLGQLSATTLIQKDHHSLSLAVQLKLDLGSTLPWDLLSLFLLLFSPSPFSFFFPFSFFPFSFSFLTNFSFLPDFLPFLYDFPIFFAVDLDFLLGIYVVEILKEDLLWQQVL